MSIALITFVHICILCKLKLVKLLYLLRSLHLLSTHDFATLGQFADKVILLNRRVLKLGTPDEVLSSPEFYETFHLRMGKGGEQ